MEFVSVQFSYNSDKMPRKTKILSTEKRILHVTDVYHKWSHFFNCVILYQRR